MNEASPGNLSAPLALDMAARKAAMRRAIVAQSVTSVGDLLYVNSFMLMYFATLGMSGEAILAYLAIPNLAMILVILPSAHSSWRLGFVRGGVIGDSICAAGLLCLLAAPFMKPYGMEWLPVLAGVCLHGAGTALFNATWFPLTGAVVPEDGRGRFFGTLRFCYQSVSILFTFLVIAVLKESPSLWSFQVFLGVSLAMKAVAIAVYARLPEPPESATEGRDSFMDSLMRAIGAPGYMPFCSYAFLLSLATGCCGSLFGLLAKGPLGLGEDEVVLIGNLRTFGALGGFYLGGKMVDKLGTKSVFLICHFAFGAVLLAFLARGIANIPPLAFVGILGTAFGTVQAASGIAMTSEMLALMPAGCKAMSSALNQALIGMGICLSGLLSSWAIKLEVLNESWTLLGAKMSHYDTLIAVCGMMVVILVVTLGLVPSVVRKVQWSSR